MSFTNGRISGITRLQIKDAAGFSFPEFDDQIQAMAFRKESATQCVVSNVGFVNINDPLDSELTTEKTLLANYRAFSLRIDRRVVPPSTLKIRIMEETKKILQETGQQCLYREQREDLRARVELELLSKVPPVTEIYDIAIDTLTGIVYVASVTAKVVDTFLDAFKEAFGIRLHTL
jgi:DNA recombination-dependent growth factor C